MPERDHSIFIQNGTDGRWSRRLDLTGYYNLYAAHSPGYTFLQTIPGRVGRYCFFRSSSGRATSGLITIYLTYIGRQIV